MMMVVVMTMVTVILGTCDADERNVDEGSSRRDFQTSIVREKERKRKRGKERREKRGRKGEGEQTVVLISVGMNNRVILSIRSINKTMI